MYYFPTQNLLFLTILWFHWAVFWLCVVVSVPLQFVQLHSKRLMAGMKRAKNGSLTHQGPHADCSVLTHTASLYTWCLIFQCFSTWWPSYSQTVWTSWQDSKSRNYQVSQGPTPAQHFFHHVLFCPSKSQSQSSFKWRGNKLHLLMGRAACCMCTQGGKESLQSSLDTLPCPLTLSVLIKVGILTATSTKFMRRLRDMHMIHDSIL